MRRPWLLLALLAPAVAGAVPPQPPVGSGEITWETIPFTDTDNYINLAECASGSIALSWSPTFLATVAGASSANVRSYQLYASNQQPNDICFTMNDTASNRFAGPVGVPITSGLNDPMTGTFDTSAIVTVAGKVCSGSGDEDIFLCMQAKDGSNTAIGVARINNGAPAKVILSRDRAPAPVNVSATPGEQAANVSWGGSGAQGESYRIDATPIGTTAVPSRSSPRFSATSYRLGGLVNDQPYTITVTAFSKAGNPNPDPSPATSVTPSHVLDFFTEYKAAGGRELGGCAGGPAGPVALVAAAAALLAIQRRRK